MPSLPSRDFSPNSPAKIVIFQTNAQFFDIFFRFSFHLDFVEKRNGIRCPLLSSLGCKTLYPTFLQYCEPPLLAGHPRKGNGPIIEVAPHLAHCHTLSSSPFLTFIPVWLLKSLMCMVLSLNPCRAQLLIVDNRLEIAAKKHRFRLPAKECSKL